MDNIANDWVSEVVATLILVVIILIILAAMGRFDTFSNRVTKKFRIKRRGRIYTRSVAEKINE